MQEEKCGLCCVDIFHLLAHARDLKLPVRRLFRRRCILWEVGGVVWCGVVWCGVVWVVVWEVGGVVWWWCGGGVVLSPPPARMSAYIGSSEVLQLLVKKKQSWILSFHCHDLSHHEIVHQPSHWDNDEEDGCVECCSSCVGLLPAILCSCSRSVTIFSAEMILMVLLYLCCVSFTVLILQPSRMYLFT